jgi:glycosyltransferase involved in cell wall biosynthesis
MLTIIIPALNEEKTLKAAVLTVVSSAHVTNVSPIEIIIVNDGSKDRTKPIISEIESVFPFVSSIHHEKNLGLRAVFLNAVAIAKYDKITLFPGDNNALPYTMQNLMRNAHRADLVLAYMLNTETRSIGRHCLSLLYFLIYTLTFNIHVKYVHGLPVYPTSKIRELKLFSKRYSVFVEINIKLLRQGISYYEVDGFINPLMGKSAALRAKNLFDAVATYINLIYEVYFKHRQLFAKRPRRVIPEGQDVRPELKQKWCRSLSEQNELH